MYVPGTVLVWMTFAAGLFSTLLYALSLKDENRWKPLARVGYLVMTLGLVGSSAVLLTRILVHDYRLAYVFNYSDNSLSLNYLVSTFWGGQEGSFLLWALWASLLGLLVYRTAGAYERPMMIVYNLTILSLVLLLLKQDPFRFLDGLAPGMIPADGNGLNPLLQNPWMVIHPPVMFSGYAAAGIPFAFAMAALWLRRYDEWVTVVMPWALVSAGTLGTAIMMGGYWAYETLGWGGFWGWDPVENASLVPWLVTVAFIHGILLQRGRQRFRRLNLVLAVAAYLLVVYATFLTRSGVLSDFSVHSFVDLGLSGWLVFNIVFFLVLSVGMLLWRWREIPASTGREPFFSRTIFFVLGILILALIALVVAFGTSAPLLTRLWMDTPAQVVPDFYNGLGFWLAIVLALVVGATPFLAWHRVRESVGRRFGFVLAATMVLMVTAWAIGARDWRSLVYVAAVVFSTVANGWALIEIVGAGDWRKGGGALSHIGLGLMLLGFLSAGGFDSEQNVRLVEGRPEVVQGVTMTFTGPERNAKGRDAMVISAQRDGGRPFELRPLMWISPQNNQLVANPDVRSGLFGDLYIAPAEYQPATPGPPSGRLTLTEGEPTAFRDWELRFLGFELDGHQGEEMVVGIPIEITRPDREPVTVTPLLIATTDGLGQNPAPIRGTDGTVAATAMAVNSGQVQIELYGLGGDIGLDRTLAIGESIDYKDLTITFDGFDLSNFDPDAGDMEFGAVFEVRRGDETHDVTPIYRQMGDGPIIQSAPIPETGGMTLSIGRVSADDGSVELRLFDPSLPGGEGEPASFVVDVSYKPLIGLVWVGTVLILAGIILAYTGRRSRAIAVSRAG